MDCQENGRNKGSSEATGTNVSIWEQKVMPYKRGFSGDGVLEASFGVKLQKLMGTQNLLPG